LEPPADVMPMTISWLGNSSVATLPTMLDLIRRGELDGHALHGGDTIVLASVGAGMHINAVVYRPSWVPTTASCRRRVFCWASREPGQAGAT
jgi:3-oxoacyl-[acyl-carrier-protein] synthase III